MVEDKKTVSEVNKIWRSSMSRLRPNYFKMCLNMLSGIIYILIGTFSFNLIPKGTSIFISILFAYIMSFYFALFLQKITAHFHEASHFNLCISRRKNDFLATLFLTPFVGLPIKAYRKSHWEHHRHLGTDKDTEISYVSPFKLISFFKLMLGIYHLETILRYSQNFKKLGSTSPKNGKNTKKSFVDTLAFSLIYFGVVQLLFMILLFLYVSPWCSVSWGIMIVFAGPTLAYARQSLEHKAYNYSSENRATNRNFGTGWFASNFGGAGFNRHILHHWSPQTHYTLFDDFEKSVLRSELRQEYVNSTTTYGSTFVNLLRERRR